MLKKDLNNTANCISEPHNYMHVLNDSVHRSVIIYSGKIMTTVYLMALPHLHYECGGSCF